MRKEVRKMTALALSSAMIMGMSTMVLADVTRDNDSEFTTGVEENTTATTEKGYFNLIKDYDSVNPTAAGPNSQSPAETLTYKITPYQVWNAGSTYANGTATKITKDNMPLLKVTADTAKGVTVSTTTDRVMTIKQDLKLGAALFEGTESNENNVKTLIELNEYDTVGDYWYEVEEINGLTTGVQYATNSETGANGAVNGETGFTRKYYIHVQVTEKIVGTNNAEPKLVSNVTMHTIAPDVTYTNATYNAGVATLYEKESGKKVNEIENKYYAGDLAITKEVTGNAGDKSDYFEVTVTFTKPAGTIVNSDIPFMAFAKSGDTYTSTNFAIKGQKSAALTGKTVVDWEPAEAGATGDTDAKKAICKFYVQDGETVTFSNIPYGINYTVTEKLPDNDTYKNKIVFTEGSKDDAYAFDGVNYTPDKDAANGILSADAKTAEGSITDPHDTITITNDKETKIDIGVVLSNAPYFALLFSAGIAAALSMRRLKKSIEE